MCGLVGFINYNSDCESVLNDMLEIQSYRGPDSNGTFIDESSSVYLGHNRLSIQDLTSHGKQPMISECKNFVITFNGEVYNFHSIRVELEKLGVKFFSNSDTEVILYSYIKWGIKCLDKFIGMFSFSIFDKSLNKIFLVRDRAGVKPLYYYESANEFVFSSELKSFHKYPNFKKTENTDILPYFFQFGYIPAPHTIFKNTYKLEAGHYLEYDITTNKKTIKQYWDVNSFYKKEYIQKDENQVLNDLEEILSDAIDLRMVSDVPVGVFLSGGYDSSLVASILAKKQNKKINTFTIGFNDKKYNEAEHAKKIAEYLDTNHTEYYMEEKDMLDLIDSLSFYYDEPFGDSSALPTMIVSKLAKKDVTVALSADGGDETFCGYSKYFFLDKFSSIFSNNMKRSLLKNTLNILDENIVENFNNYLPKKVKQTNIKDKFNKFKRAINSEDKEDMFLTASSYVDKNLVSSFLEIKKDDILFEKFEKIEGLEFINEMMAIDYKTFMCDDVLTKVDRATMSVSLEGREPLLDHRIIEYMAMVPLSLKYKNKQGKYLLRQILYKYLPKEMVDKPKAGFQIPLNEWLRNELKSKVEKYINKEKLDKKVFNIQKVIELKFDFFNGKDYGTQIWFILVYQMWKEKWFE